MEKSKNFWTFFLHSIYICYILALCDISNFYDIVVSLPVIEAFYSLLIEMFIIAKILENIEKVT